MFKNSQSCKTYQTTKLPSNSTVKVHLFESTMQNERESELLELEKTLYEAISKKDRDERSKYYEQAIARCPDLVERESNPLAFLRACQGDTQAAAQKLLLYWQRRVSLFGERAFLPMEATGNAALTEQEASETLRADLIQPLPQDAENCMVLLMQHQDRQTTNTKERNNANNNNHLRLLFYWLQVCSEYPESQTKGLVLLHVQHGAPKRTTPCEVAAETSHSSNNAFLRSSLKGIQQMIDESFPIKVKATHSCLVSTSPEDDIIFEQQVIPSLRRAIPGSFSLMIHSGSTKDILKALQASGMSKESLPPVVGGSWHPDWLTHSHGAAIIHYEGVSAANDTGQNSDVMDADDGDQDESLSTSSEEDRKPAAIITPKTSTPVDSDHEDRLSQEEKEQLQMGLEKALDEIPSDEKKELEHAKEAAPLLFITECDPLQFLVVGKQESRRAQTAAAQRLVSYWKHRIGLFGEGRAFLPLNQTGNGALNENDVALLRTGFVAPIFGDDRSITLCFRSSHHRQQHNRTKFTTQAKLRCIFYVLAAVLQLNGASLPQCVSTKTLSSSSSVPRSSRRCQLRLLLSNMRDKQLKRTLSMIEECFPVQVKSIHLAVIAPRGATRVFQENFASEMNAFASQEIKEKMFLHVANTKAELLSDLIGKGLSKDTIPEPFGGEWTYSRFDAWRQARVSFESSRLDQQQVENSLANLGALAEQALQDTEATTVASAATTSSTTQTKEAREVEIAMGQVPHDLKEAYLEAKQLVPDLVEKESNPKLFLLCEGNNALAAAQCLAGYWKKRKEIFVNKAFLPLNQTGEGALSRGDMNLLSSGFMALLPKLSTGHTVLCYDGSRLSKAPKDSQLRVAFYWFSVAAENSPKSQTDGIVLLHLIDKLNTTVRDKRQPLDAVLQALPIHIKVLHAIASTTVRSVTDRGIHGAVNKLFGASYSRRVIPYGGALGNALVLHLRAHGLSVAGIPKSIGGSWGYERFVRYIELRTRYEWDLPPGSGSKDLAKLAFDFSGVRNLSDLNEEERTERRRRMNVLHSRRKRERERIEIEVLQEQCADLQYKNKQVFLDNSRLEDMLQTAQRKIAGIAAQDRPTARREYSLASMRQASSSYSQPQDYRRASLGSGSASSSSATSAAAAATAVSYQIPAASDALLAQQLLLLSSSSSGQLGRFGPQILPGNDKSPWQELLLAQQQQQQQQQQQSLLQRTGGDPLLTMRLQHAMEERLLQQLLLQQQQQQQALLSSIGNSAGMGTTAAAAALGGAAGSGNSVSQLSTMLQVPWLVGGLTAVAPLPMATGLPGGSQQRKRQLSDIYEEEDDDEKEEDEEDSDE